MQQRTLLDTDILVDFFHNQKYAKDIVEKLVRDDGAYISILSIAELRAGFTLQQAKTLLPKLYKMAVIVDLSLKIAELGGKLRSEYGSKGKSLSTVDTLIAATAIIGDFQLVTRNKKDFPMRELNLYPL